MIKESWLQKLPHPVVLLFGMLMVAGAMSYILPAGQFERIAFEGREKIVPGTFTIIPSSPLTVMDMFLCIPAGFKAAIEIIFVILISGVMFGFMEASGAIENAIGSLVNKMPLNQKHWIVVIMTFVFSSLGIFIGYESNIAVVPMACMLSLAIGGDLMLGAAISVAAITVGFGLSPINPYTIGTGQKIAELPLFSGSAFRTVLCLGAIFLLAWYNVRYYKKIQVNPNLSMTKGVKHSGFELSKSLENCVVGRKDAFILATFLMGMVAILIGVFYHQWYINHISAVFCILVVIMGLINRYNPRDFGENVLKYVALVAPGAFVVGLANAIKIALDKGHITDTLAFHISSLLEGLSLYTSAISMVILQAFMNFIIPSGSGQALATLPILIPVSEVIGLTRQTTVLAFQLGDGLSNLVNPSSGGLIAMLSLCRVDFEVWLIFISRFFIVLFGLSLLVICLSVFIQFGPF